MNILILGSTGGTGQELVKQSLEQGHEVTVLVRDPIKLNINHENLTILKGNVLDKTILMTALAGKEVVLSALGLGKSLKSKDLISNAVGLLIPAMNAANVKRLIFLSAFGVGETFIQATFIQKIIFKTFLRNMYADKLKADEQIQRSGLDWTLVYPVLLTDGPFSGKYRAGDNFRITGMSRISRADVADFMLRNLSDNSFIKKSPVIMN